VTADGFREFIASDSAEVHDDESWFSRDAPPDVEADEQPPELPGTVEEAARWFAERGASLTVAYSGTRHTPT
jgi:hypothetical protein